MQNRTGYTLIYNLYSKGKEWALNLI